MTECTHCNADLPEGLLLCNTGADDLRRILGRVRDTLNTAGGTLTNTAAAPEPIGGGGGGQEAPGLPYSHDMSTYVGEYQDAIRRWCTLLANHYGGTAPRDTIMAARFMFDRIGIIRGDEAAGDLLSEIRAAERSVINAADRQAPKLLLGECGTLQWAGHKIEPCPGQIIGREGDDQAKCDTCRSTHSARERVEAKVSQAWHVAAPLPTVLRALKQGGHASIPQNRADKWASMGKLEHATEHPETGRKLYTPAAVLEAFRKTPTGKRQHAQLK